MRKDHHSVRKNGSASGRVALLVIFVLFPCSLLAQQSYQDFTASVQTLYHASSKDALDRGWNALVSRKAIPIVQHDSVAFLYRGDARKVVWMGDFNGWGNSRTFKNEGKRIPGTDVWILKVSLPEDARLDYKILIDDNRWLVDPVNPRNQWSGVGGGSLNSELQMPAWTRDSVTADRLSGAARGVVEEDILFQSVTLGYQVTYSIYTPPGYQPRNRYPVVYVTDGYEYMHERMGNMVTILDNLIFLGRMRPVVAVFIDHRDPINRSVNRRMQELAMHDRYHHFLTDEFIPKIEARWNITDEPSQRAVIGNSLGGLSALWLAFSRPDVFGLAGIQSPALWFNPSIYKLCEESAATPRRLFVTTGRIHDGEDGVRKMAEIFTKKGCPFEVVAVNQGPSWGNWRDLADDMLCYLFPPRLEQREKSR